MKRTVRRMSSTSDKPKSWMDQYDEPTISLFGYEVTSTRAKRTALMAVAMPILWPGFAVLLVGLYVLMGGLILLLIAMIPLLPIFELLGMNQQEDDDGSIEEPVELDGQTTSHDEDRSWN